VPSCRSDSIEKIQAWRNDPRLRNCANRREVREFRAFAIEGVRNSCSGALVILEPPWLRLGAILQSDQKDSHSVARVARKHSIEGYDMIDVRGHQVCTNSLAAACCSSVVAQQKSIKTNCGDLDFVSPKM